MPVPPELVCDQRDAGRSGRELGYQVGAWGGEGSVHGSSQLQCLLVVLVRHLEIPRGLADDYWF